MSLKHCTGEKLLAYLDDELAPRESGKVRHHLSACWRCRARARELESSIVRLAQEFSAGSRFPDEWQVADAKSRFLTWRDRVQPSNTKFSMLAWRLPPAIATSLAMVPVVLASVALWSHFQPTPASVLRKAEATERSFLCTSRAVHETYRFEIKRTLTLARTSKGRLEVWSQPTAKRFAWRWKDDEDRLKFAEWHPSPEEEYFFDRQSAGVRALHAVSYTGRPSLADIGQPNARADELNKAFIGWIRAQDWRLISIARDFSLFSSRQGVTLSVRRVHSAGGDVRFVLEARRSVGDRDVRLSLEIDEATGRPLMEAAVVTDPGGTIEIRVISDQAGQLHELPATLENFRPDIEMAGDGQLSKLIPRPRTVLRKRASSAVDPRLLDAGEVQVLFALHQAGLCLGSPLKVSQEKSLNMVQLTGLVDGQKDKETILAIIAQLPSASLIRTNVKTLTEAAAKSKPLYSTVSSQGGSGSITSFSAMPIETLINESSLPAAQARELKSEAPDLSNHLISAAETLVREAWALHRLTVQISPVRFEGMGVESRKLVLSMATDHVMSLHRTASEIDSALAPFRVLDPGSDAQLRKPAANAVAQDFDISKDFGALVQSAELINGQLRALFAFGGSAKSLPGESVNALFEALPRFNALMEQASTVSARMYGNGAVRSAEHAEVNGLNRPGATKY